MPKQSRAKLMAGTLETRMRTLGTESGASSKIQAQERETPEQLALRRKLQKKLRSFAS